MSLPGALVPWVPVQFLDDDGSPLAGGSVTFYDVGTTTPKNTYTNADLAVGHENTNPVVLDAAGRAVIFLAAGGYDVIVKDADGNTIVTRSDVEDVGLTFCASLGTTWSGGSKDVNSGYEVLPTDYLVTTDSSETTNPCILQLPAASARVSDDGGNGNPLWIKNFAAVPVSITPNGNDQIDNAGAGVVYTLAAASSPLNPCVGLVSDGISAWFVITGPQS